VTTALIVMVANGEDRGVGNQWKDDTMSATQHRQNFQAPGIELRW